MTRNSPFPPRAEKRSPFPKPSLPQPGESTYDALLSVYLWGFAIYALLAVSVLGMTIASWSEHWFPTPKAPWVYSGATVMLALVTLYRWFKIQPQMDQLQLGMRGEREVGRMLEEFRTLGYRVFHDIPGDVFNVDHALIGPGGIFAIETKTRTKPGTGTPTVEYDGKCIRVNGIAPDRDPVAQAEGAAAFLQDFIKRQTDKDVRVRPVVVFPGWFVTKQPRGCRTWVLNEKVLRPFIENETRHLSDADIALFADRLTQHLCSPD